MLQNTQISNTAAKAVRYDFNPSTKSDISEIKELTATLISKLEAIYEGASDGEQAALSKCAIRHVQTASMWSVLAATYNS